jgi:outer membrane protein TolC
LVQSDQAVSLNLIQLYKALGGGWEQETNSTPSMAEAH